MNQTLEIASQVVTVLMMAIVGVAGFLIVRSTHRLLDLLGDNRIVAQRVKEAAKETLDAANATSEKILTIHDKTRDLLEYAAGIWSDPYWRLTGAEDALRRIAREYSDKARPNAHTRNQISPDYFGEHAARLANEINAFIRDAREAELYRDGDQHKRYWSW
jgi:hypothetical protein